MAIFLLLTLTVCFVGMKPAKNGEFHSSYISVAQTTAINGLFTILVFFSHVSTYISLDGAFDKPYSSFKSYLLQLVVAPFLFYSGYGITESIKKKGTDYVKQIPKNRFLKVLVHFDIAVALFVILNAILGRSFPLKKILLAFTGYTSVGNSNWYIFAVLGLYVIVFIAFMLARKSKVLGVILTTLLSIGFVYLQMRLRLPEYYYDTAIIFSAGMIFSLLREKAEKLLTKHEAVYYTVLGLTFLAYTLFYLKRKNGIEFYSMWGILFMVLVVLFTMKVQIGNGILEFFGSHVFSIYILQRIPMLILTKLGLAASHKYVFVSLCFFATVAMAVLFDLAMDKLDGVLFRKRVKKAVAAEAEKN